MNKRKIVRVRDVMKKQFDLVDRMTTISDALKAMEHLDNKSLIVDKRNEDDEYGIVLISDVAKKVLAKGRAANRVNCYEIMTKPVVTVDPKMDIRYCARLFDRFSLSRAPVVEHGKIIGIISFTDMVLKGLCQYDES